VLLFGISEVMILICDDLCNAVLRSWFANWFATFFTRACRDSVAHQPRVNDQDEWAYHAERKSGTSAQKQTQRNQRCTEEEA
jgi:hypothetical protein